ncbi:hypothetical protein HW555_006056 [Spodoptera exigua]|uniref:Uncharacterized protein n=1 Tax=Spodoptera exigua TaxID=7107 RepID=A0A835L4V6_SPOEX|nr:hypothetical protein HW555_006056 [Spodoptera exigua]
MDKVCVTTSVTNSICQSLSINDSRFTCQRVESRVECAQKLVNREAHVAYFSEEETLLLAQQQPTENRVIATVRDVNKLDLGFCTLRPLYLPYMRWGPTKPRVVDAAGAQYLIVVYIIK